MTTLVSKQLNTAYDAMRYTGDGRPSSVVRNALTTLLAMALELTGQFKGSITMVDIGPTGDEWAVEGMSGTLVYWGQHGYTDTMSGLKEATLEQAVACLLER